MDGDRVADAPDAAIPIGGKLTVQVTRRNEGTTSVFGLNVAIDGSWELNPGSDVVASLEEDATWIVPPSGTVPEGLTVELIALPHSGPPQPRPGLLLGGLGIRISRASGPLLDAGVSFLCGAAPSPRVVPRAPARPAPTPPGSGSPPASPVP